MYYKNFTDHQVKKLNNKKLYMGDRITLFGRIDWTTYGLKTITIQDAIDIIRNGTYYIDDNMRSGMSGTLREITEKIQSLPEGTDLQRIKQQFLPAVSFNGIYNKGIIDYSNVTALDFDHIPTQEEFTDLYLHLMNIPCVAYIYRTPSGKGLKAIIWHNNNNPDLHGNLYRQLMVMFQTPYITTDSHCQDLNRRNYLCYDPNVWINPYPIPFNFVYDAAFDRIKPSDNHTAGKIKQIQTQRTKPVIALGLPSDASIMNMLKSRCKRFHSNYLIEGARRDGVYWYGTQAAKAGVDYQYGLDFVKQLYQSNEITLTRGGTFTENEITENYTNGYDTESYDENYRKNFKYNYRGYGS